MEVTRRFWMNAGLIGALAGFGAVVAHPAPLIGAALIGARLLGRQFAFIRTLADLVTDLTRGREAGVAQVLARDRAATDASVPYMLEARLSAPSPLNLAIEAGIPVAANVEGDRVVNIVRGESEASTTGSLTWPVAGRFRFDPPTLEATDPNDLFHERLPLDKVDRPTMTVEPRRPQNVHIGASGEQIMVAYGDHEGGPVGSGLDPVTIREYVPGDSVRQIDWKATARLAQPHIREFETETERTTVLFVDHRASMGQGPAGETKLDYARHVALTYLADAREYGDPLGCFGVNDEGVTLQRVPSAEREEYETIRTLLSDLEPSVGEIEEPQRRRTPAEAHRIATLLADDDSAFATQLRPFVEAMGMHPQRVEREPLFAAIRTHLRRIRGLVWTVIVTDDTHRAELREAVTLARRRENRVLVFLTPTVLFEAGALADVNEAYERYADFEAFRRSLARMERVWAFEVAPQDRIETVLAAGSEDRHERTRIHR